MKKYFLFFFTLILSFNISASHFIGGEITWECDTDPMSPNYGKYTFFLHIYQDCDGIDFSYFSEDITVHNHPSLFNITCNWLDTNDISTSGISGSATCYDCDNQPFGTFGAVKEWIYSSGPITITGTPPANGWHFTWGTCCRSSNLTQGMNDADWTIRSVMYAYTDPSGTVFPNNDICHDNSPIFKERPKTILCTGYPFSYSHLAFDVELDSLSYSWAEPLGDELFYDPNNPNGIALPFNAPYSVNSPIPGNPTLNNENGEISFLSNTAGIFVTCVKVESYKCGQLVAEVFRDVNVALISCGTLPNGAQNLPPVITAPVGSQNWITTLNPSTNLPSYETTIMAGELVNFSVIATDNDVNITGNKQNLTLEVEGGQLDPLLALSNAATFIVDSLSPGFVSGDFLWESNCDHMQDYGCGRQGGAYTFNLKAYDDFCPANGIVIATITINVIPPQPDLRCLAVDSAGGVELHFYFPAGVVDTNIKYDIYHSKQINGPYLLLDSIFYPDTNYYHAGSDANSSRSYYYLLGSVTCGTNIGGASDSLLFSDTLSTILMDAYAVNFGNTAEMNWNPIHNPLLSSSSSDYDLHYINAYNSDNIIAVLADTFYSMDSDNCNYFPQFYVEISDISGCSSVSSIATINLLDTISPVTPTIESVSVNNQGKSEISWTNSPGADYYIIYIQDANGAWVTLDSVSFPQNSYMFDDSQAEIRSESFNVRAVDSCANSRVKSLEHNSMLLTYSSDPCDYSIQLDWNEYINWNGGTNHYKVLITETDNENVTTISEVRIEGNTNLIIEDIGSSSDYIIVIEAYNSDSSLISRSNEVDINIALANRPLFNYIEYATINHENGSIDISCLVDLSGVINHYDVYRSIKDSENFSKIGQVDFSNTNPIYYNDPDVSIDNHSYQYKIYPVDTCGVSLFVPLVNLPEYSNIMSFAQTIYLEAAINIDTLQDMSVYFGEYTNTLIFNKYEKWLGNVAKYYLYRSFNGEPFNSLPIYTWDRINNPDEELIYTDVVTDFYDGNGKFCYYIEAVEGGSTVYGPTIEGSKSNIVCVSQVPTIFIPSVFTPNGDENNEVFMPITYFVSTKGYTFSIYNRDGDMIFETNNPKKGWDGSFLGSQVQNGNYVYHLKFINGDGILTEKKGIITLVR